MGKGTTMNFLKRNKSYLKKNTDISIEKGIFEEGMVDYMVEPSRGLYELLIYA